MGNRNVRRDLVEAMLVVVTTGGAVDPQHPSLRLLAEANLGLLSQGTGRSIDHHMGKCRVCRSRAAVLLSVAEAATNKACAARSALGIPVTGADLLLSILN